MKISQKISKKTNLGGRDLILETGILAEQADAAIMARYGDTVVLATVVSAKPQVDLGYFPLFVEYLERLYAGGKIKGSRWVKREGHPSDEAILAGRVVDRSIRPLFPAGFYKEVQVIITVLSVDGENDPVPLATIAASAALAISKIPWKGPIGAVKVGMKDNQYFVNPAASEMKFSDLDLLVTSTKKVVVMIEAGTRFISEEQMLGGIKFASQEAKKVIDLIEELVTEAGVKKEDFIPKMVKPEVKKEVRKVLGSNLKIWVKRFLDQDLGREEWEELSSSIIEKMPEATREEIKMVLEEIFKEEFRKNILLKKRPDGRKIDEIRPISTEIGILPRTHGSALFQRGQTQVLTVTTLGSPSLEQLIESAEGEETKRFIHHYSMPPYSSGEVGRFGFPSRRETGHGALAEKALEPVVPSEEKFPYTIRLVSEVLSSNGSTSMASTCASALSLMDAGVPISEPVAGIAIGLVEEGKEHIILTDIAGAEDQFGDMDFKIAGTQKGITAIQLDVKNEGLTENLIKEALERGQEARVQILEIMRKTIPESRVNLSQYAPKVRVVQIPIEKIGEVIGPGGRIIRKLIEETKASIEVEDDGHINISGADSESVEKAVAAVESLTKEVKAGEEYEGIVKRIQPFGAFVEVLPGKEGLVHVSQMSSGFVKDPGEIVSLGQKVKVRVVEIDDLGRINLSMLSEEEAKRQKQEGSKSPSRPMGPRNEFRPRFPSSRRSRW